MKSILFDLESDGLLKTVSKVHCIALLDTDTGEQWSYKYDEIEKALEDLYDADVLIGHNIISYDFPVLRKLYNWNYRPGTRIIDTLVTARLLRPNIKQDDFTRINFEPKLIGSHSLRAWGQRLRVPKADYEGTWEKWTPEMHSYMEQDVRTNYSLLRDLRPWEFPPVPLKLEHRATEICHEIWTHGWTFDQKKAHELYVTLVKRRDELEKTLVQKFGQWEEVDKVLIPKRDNKKLGYVKDIPVTKMKTVTFNPRSRMHIDKKLREAGWVPTEFLESGRAKLDEAVLSKIDQPEAELLVEYLLVTKRLGQIGDGDSAWLRLVENDGRIHGSINPNGCISSRATHSSPNISQVPANRAQYGKECRSCFTVPKGWKLVGADMSGLELRCFAHYLAKYDQGEYAKVVTEGDVHTFNQNLAGLETRDQAKTFIYALLYGASSKKLGVISGKSEKDGSRLKSRFMDQMPAYAKLVEFVASKCPDERLEALDGRYLPIRSEHSALNVLLQGTGAILCKTWLVAFYDQMCANSYIHGYDGDYVICGWIHDELQVACREQLAETVGQLLVEQAKSAGEPYGFKVPLDSSYVIGNNWSETH